MGGVNRTRQQFMNLTVLLEEELDVCQMLLGRPKLTRLLNCHLLHLIGKEQNDAT